jgi:hypothetical protein
MSPQPNTAPATTPKADKPDETPRERFVRIVELRTGNAIESIRKLAPLGNKSQYEYDESDIEKIEGALTAAVKATVGALKTGKPSASTFKL